MSFFRVDTKFSTIEEPTNKLRYVIDTDGKGRWIRPTMSIIHEEYRLPYDYDEDIYY